MRGDAAPFEFQGDPRGVLCVHGFTGSPFELRYLGERLHERGLTVSCPVLPGHCTTPEDLDETTWADWYAAVVDAFDALRARCEQVAVVGQSMGGALTLHLARARGPQIAAIATLATPLWLPPLARGVIALYRHTPLRRVVPILRKTGDGSDVRDPLAKRANPAYSGLPARALLELDELLRTVRAEIPRVHTPALVVHARQDHTAPYECSTELARRLGSTTVERRTLFGSYHVIGIDVERDLVARDVGVFLEQQLARARKEAS